MVLQLLPGGSEGGASIAPPAGTKATRSAGGDHNFSLFQGASARGVVAARTPPEMTWRDKRSRKRSFIDQGGGDLSRG